MKSKVALIIIFNHKYDNNIQRLEELYGSRFSNIFFLVPFYNGDKKNVIAVYENSIYFQGYLAQGYKYFYNEIFEHYLFIGDDLILNPAIDENNYQEYFNLNTGFSFLPGLVSFHECGPWPRIKEAYRYNIKHGGVEAVSELPSYNDAMDALRKLNMHLEPMNYNRVYKLGSDPKKKKNFEDHFKNIYRRFKYFFKSGKFNLSYPLIGSYADIFIVSSDVIQKFCKYCGVFAATELHVEIAIPTALAFSTSKIVTEINLKLRRRLLWSDDDLKELDKYNFELNNLLNNFPENYLYLHPVKLSKWK